MARVRVMYWKEIPVQVQAEDEDNRVTRQLDERFQKAVDAVAMIDGSQGTDEYLEARIYRRSMVYLLGSIRTYRITKI